MAAPPERVWEVVSDVTQIGRYSPETVAAEWLDGATGPEVGARFRGKVKRNGRGPTYWTTCKVVECEPPRRFAFAVVYKDEPMNVWRYELEPSGDGTDVTESFELQPSLPLRIYWALAGWIRGPANERRMRATLEKMREVVEAGPGA